MNSPCFIFLSFQWLKLTSDDVKEQIFKLAKKGLTPSQIGTFQTRFVCVVWRGKCQVMLTEPVIIMDQLKEKCVMCSSLYIVCVMMNLKNKNSRSCFEGEWISLILLVYSANEWSVSVSIYFIFPSSFCFISLCLVYWICVRVRSERERVVYLDWFINWRFIAVFMFLLCRFRCDPKGFSRRGSGALRHRQQDPQDPEIQRPGPRSAGRSVPPDQKGRGCEEALGKE